MSPDGAPRPAEKAPILVTARQLEQLQNPDPTFGDDLEFLELMHELGLKFDGGPVVLNVDGKRIKISTDTGDFGTVIAEDLRDI